MKIQVAALGDATSSFRDVAAGQLNSLRDTSKSLARRAVTEDVTTGTTPQKRKWEYEDEWDVVKDRATAIKRWHEQQQAPIFHSDLNPEIGSASSPDVVEEAVYVDYVVPLAPEEDDDENEDMESAATASALQPTVPPPALEEVVPLPSRPDAGAPAPRQRMKSVQPPFPVTNKPSGIARVPRRMVSGSGAIVNSAAPRGSGALAERSKATGRKRDKAA